MGIRIERLQTNEAVYDITVEDNHNFFANNILVHNCLEIALPTKPLKSVDDPDGEVALCTLSAFNLGAIDDLSELDELSDLIVRALDSLLDYQDYPLPAAEASSKNRRTLGVGAINYAYHLVKNGKKYSDGSANNLTHRTFEAMQYYLMKASMNLAKEFGPCEWFGQTKLSKGILPIDTYKKSVDKLVTQDLILPWEELRADIKMYGMRNSTVSALMPSECQSLYNELKLATGDNITLGSAIQQFTLANMKQVHDLAIPGQRFGFTKPLELADGSTAYECYYNGIKALTQLTFEDGNTYKFTENHQLLVNRNSRRVWVQVKDLTENDDIISIQ